MNYPTFNYHRNPFEVNPSYHSPYYTNEYNYPQPKKEKNYLKGFLITFFGILLVICLYLYRKTIKTYIIKLKRKLLNEEGVETLKLDELRPQFEK